MKLRKVSDILALVLLVISFSLLSESSTAGIERTAKRWYMFDIYGGTSMAHGEYEGIGATTFITESGNSLKIGADDLYEDGTHFGVDYGMMRTRTLFSLGFRYTDIEYKDVVIVSGYMPFLPFDPYAPSNVNLTQWDVDVTVHHYLANLSLHSASPYMGVGMQVGATSQTADGFNSINRSTFALSLDFGADVKVSSGEGGRSFVTLSSVNSYQFVGTSDRPKYL
ncbi:MAG: hypothetical protein HY851_04105, partial [candidate division Zixibacteria bacterium]|nr:hypothetical protein [candidate division Zixibacteria bacterium]